MTPWQDPKDFSSLLFESSPSLGVHCNGVFAPPPTLVLFLSILLMHLGLHRILK